MSPLDQRSVLITGGTGSFGHAFVTEALKSQATRIVVYSRDELKQWEMSQRFDDERLRFFLGDVRDRNRLSRALNGIDVVVHAAALKQVPAAEYNPTEFIRTNVEGAMNVVESALDRHVKHVVALSTDKASSPINLYGASKLCSDKLFLAANGYGGNATRFNVVRYGNVMGSRGSVVPHFLQLIREDKPLTITDAKMTRFWCTMDRAVRLVMQAMEDHNTGSIYVPKIPSFTITDLAEAMDASAPVFVTGIRPGEKLHEEMISEHDAHRTREFPGHYTIGGIHYGGQDVKEGFSYRSDNNKDWLTPSGIFTLLPENIRKELTAMMGIYDDPAA